MTSTRLILFIVVALSGSLVGCSPAKQQPYQWSLPEHIPLPDVPAANPMTNEKVELGRWLFYETGLSGNQQQSCASCHQQQFGFAEPRVSAQGSTGQTHRRNSLALINIAYTTDLTWAHNGLSSIEQQLLIPMFGEHPVELGITGNEQQVLARLTRRGYAQRFNDAFGDSQITFERINQALASFVRSLTSFNSPFDRYAYLQQDDALSDAAVRGLNLFFSERLECFHCHGGFNFSQSSVHQGQSISLRKFHNTGLYNVDGRGGMPASDTGLYELTLERKDMGRFRAPTLRNIANTAPYMHDGSLATLEEVIEFYNQGGQAEGRDSPFKSPFIKVLNLSEQEKQDLLAFLQSLSDQQFLTNPAFADPREQ